MFNTAQQINGFDDFQSKLREVEREQVERGMTVFVLRSATGILAACTFVFLGAKLFFHKKDVAYFVVVTISMTAFTAISSALRFRKMRDKLADYDARA